MSQEYFPRRGEPSSSGEGSSRRFRDGDQAGSPFFPRAPPEYMTVGQGTTSESAMALMASLNRDSGYGSSIAGDSAMDAGSWHSGLMEDKPTPKHTPTLPGEFNPAGSYMGPHATVEKHADKPFFAAEHEKQVVASHVHQLL